MSEIKAQEAEGADGSKVQTQAGDLELLAALIECEAGGEPYEGKLAVGSVVLNRVASSHFPNSVVGGHIPERSVFAGSKRSICNRIGKGSRCFQYTGGTGGHRWQDHGQMSLFPEK